MKLLKLLVCFTAVICFVCVLTISVGAAGRDAFKNFGLDEEAIQDGTLVGTDVTEFIETYCDVGFLEGGVVVPRVWSNVIGFIKTNSYIGFLDIDFGDSGDPAYAVMTLDKNADNVHNDCYIEIRLDDPEGPVVGTIKLPQQEEWEALGVNYKDENDKTILVAHPFKSTETVSIKETHTVYFVFLNEDPEWSNWYGNVHSVWFEKDGGTPKPTDPVSGNVTGDTNTPSGTTAKERPTPGATTSGGGDKTNDAPGNLAAYLIAGGAVVVVGGGALTYFLMKKKA